MQDLVVHRSESGYRACLFEFFFDTMNERTTSMAYHFWNRYMSQCLNQYPVLANMDSFSEYSHPNTIKWKTCCFIQGWVILILYSFLVQVHLRLNLYYIDSTEHFSLQGFDLHGLIISILKNEASWTNNIYSEK